jgi:hypothetical protein
MQPHFFKKYILGLIKSFAIIYDEKNPVFFKVNFASMLEKCLVGRLVTKQKPKENASIKAKSLPTRLRFDFRQPDPKSLTLFIYTTCVTLTKENIFVYIENSKKIYVLVFIDAFVHTIVIGEYYKNLIEIY